MNCKYVPYYKTFDLPQQIYLFVIKKKVSCIFQLHNKH